MKRHLTASAVGTDRRNEAISSRRTTTRAQDRITRSRHRQPGLGRPKLRLASAKVWTHTLKLTGELNHRSAHLLEAEIDRLYEEGVDGITLDLSGLAQIDAIGVAVIAFRCKLCQRRGCDFALIRGPRSIHRVFERAGVAELLPFRDDEIVAARLSTSTSDQRVRR